MFVKLDGDTKVASAVDIVMARAKRIYILIIKVNKLCSFFSLRCFVNEKENMYSVFLSSYRNTRESLGELKHFHLRFYNWIATVHVFYFLNTILLTIHVGGDVTFSTENLTFVQFGLFLDQLEFAMI